MASVPVYILLGGENAEGGNSAAALTSYPQYEGEQAGYKIWNQISGEWELYNAGVNSAPSSLVDVTRFGPEASMLEKMQARDPEQPLIYLFKLAVVGSVLGPLTGEPNWSPAMEDLFTDFQNQWQAAVNALPLGDDPGVRAVFWVQGEGDASGLVATAYAPLLKVLVEEIRSTLPPVDMAVPFIIGKLHSHQPDDAAKPDFLEVRRAQAEVGGDFEAARAVGTDDLSLKVDDLLYDVGGTIALGHRLFEGLAVVEGEQAEEPGEDAPPAEDATEEITAPLFIVIGSANAVGHAPIGYLPAYLQGPLANIRLWNTAQGQFNDLQAGGSVFGPELSLAHELRRFENKTIYMVKVASDNNTLAPWSFYDNWTRLGSLYEGMVEAVRAAVQSNPDLGIKIKGVFFIHGELDALDYPTSQLYQAYLEILVRHLRQDLNEFLAGGRLPFIIAQAHKETAGDQIDFVRAAQQARFDSDPLVGIYDTSGLTFLIDSIWFDAESVVKLGGELAKAFEDQLGTQVIPLFVPTLTELKARLRLTGVPKGADAHAMISDGVLGAREIFYRRLSQTRVEQLRAFPRTRHTMSSEEHLRQIAEQTEVKVVRLDLMKSMPVLFQDSSAVALQEWNQNGILRAARLKEKSDQLNLLQAEIEENFQILAGEEFAGSETNTQIYDGSPAVVPPRAGSSVFF